MAGLAPTRQLPVAYFALGCDGLQNCGKDGVSLAYTVDNQTLVAAGTFMKHKGLGELVSAMEILWAESCGTRLLLLGGDPREDGERAQLSSRPAFGRTLFMPGYVSDAELAETLRRCGALVCASHDEGFGLPLVEAAALGCPVIARDIEIFRETSGGDAFFFQNGDAGKIAGALRKWFALSRGQQRSYVPQKSLITWRQSAEMLKAIMFNGASSFSVEVGLKATINLAVPGRSAGAV
jgi:glycosyltransferase involved in cell wall biosynthesis